MAAEAAHAATGAAGTTPPAPERASQEPGAADPRSGARDASAAPADAGMPAGNTVDAADAASPSRLPAVTSVEQDGPFETAQDLATGPRGQSGLFYPTDLGRDGVAHPIFVWGCGGGSRPASYAMHLRRIASHGFVVIAEVSTIGDDGAALIAALDWLVGEHGRPASMFFDKLDIERVAAGGHSIGSVNTFFIAGDPRLTTTVHVAGGSLDDVNNPFAPTSGLGGMRLVHPVAYICSESDVFGNVEKTEQDYAATTVPAFFTIMRGTDHVAAAAEGLTVIVAWLRFQLAGEAERAAMFLGPDCDFCAGKYMSRTKNW
jgi:hypothetical protein